MFCLAHSIESAVIQTDGTRNFLLRDFIVAALALMLVVAAFVVPHLGLGSVTPDPRQYDRVLQGFFRRESALRIRRRSPRLGHPDRSRSGGSGRDVGSARRRSAPVAPSRPEHLGNLRYLGDVIGDDRRVAARIRRPADLTR